MTLCLAMIVRDEAAGIVRTLESVKAHVDRWCIVDTGSRDGTPTLILKAMRGVPGMLHTEPFVDFATTRNKALDLAETMGPGWTLMLSGDAIVQGAERLPYLVELAEFAEADAVQVPIRRHSIAVDTVQEYPQAILTRNGADCRYVYPTHELLVVPGDRRANATDLMTAPPSVHYTVDETKSRARWETDRTLLQAALDANPEDERSTYYLAQTLECLGENEAAARLFLIRARMARGNEDERYCALLRRARCLWRLKRSTSEVADAFRYAVAFAPDRAEALLDLANVYWAGGALGAALDAARRAAALPIPCGRKDVEPDAYKKAPYIAERIKHAIRESLAAG